MLIQSILGKRACLNASNRFQLPLLETSQEKPAPRFSLLYRKEIERLFFFKAEGVRRPTKPRCYSSLFRTGDRTALSFSADPRAPFDWQHHLSKTAFWSSIFAISCGFPPQHNSSPTASSSKQHAHSVFPSARKPPCTN